MTDILNTIKPTGLFREPLCRPIYEHEAADMAYKKHFPIQEVTISLRPLNLTTDIETVFEWVNQEYAHRHWQKDNGPVRQLRQTYELILHSDFAQSFTGFMNDIPVCQLDVYHAPKNEISLAYNAHPGDYGINILLSPAYEKASGYSVCMLLTFLEYFFLQEEVHRIVGEPATDDLPANELLSILGFQFHKRINLSYKRANLYTCTKDNFREAIRTFVH